MELTKLKAVPVPPAGLLSFPLKALISALCACHVKGHRDETQGQEDEQEEEDPKDGRHVLRINHGLKFQRCLIESPMVPRLVHGLWRAALLVPMFRCERERILVSLCRRLPGIVHAHRCDVMSDE